LIERLANKNTKKSARRERNSIKAKSSQSKRKHSGRGEKTGGGAGSQKLKKGYGIILERQGGQRSISEAYIRAKWGCTRGAGAKGGD